MAVIKKRTVWRRVAKGVPLILVTTLVGYTLWAVSGRGLPYSTSELRLSNVETFGHNAGHGNLIAIEPWVVPQDYASEEALFAKLDSYFVRARQEGWLRSDTVVVLPEYLGTWLVVADEKRQVYDEESLEEAMKTLAASNLPPTALQALRSPSSDRMQYAVLSFKADRIAVLYDNVLSKLASTYGVWLVGGSVVLPSPTVQSGHLVAGSGPLYNVSPVYSPEGRAQPALAVKCFPTKDEQAFLNPGKLEDLPIFETTAGRLAVLVCADAWFPESFDTVVSKGATIVVSPSFGPEAKDLSKKWTGYSGWHHPPDVDPDDPKTITELEAVDRYGFGARASKYPSVAGLTSTLSGRLWDFEIDSFAITVSKGKTGRSRRVSGASIVNLWLP